MTIELILVSVVLITILFTCLMAAYKVVIRNIKKQMVPVNGVQTSKTSSESDLEEKRQDPRIDIFWPVLLETSRGKVAATIKDLSLGGAFIACKEPLPIKEQFNLTINMPDQQPMTLVSEVVWSNSNVPDDKIVTRGMGISFTQNTKEIRKSFNNAIVSFFCRHQENSLGSGDYSHPRHTEQPLAAG